MKIKFLASCLGLLIACQASAKSDACNARFRCTQEYNPVVCQIGDSNLFVKGSNNCIATANAYKIMCDLDITSEEGPLNCEPTQQQKKKPHLCPEVFPVAPDFCEEGTIKVDKDSQGCDLAPRCISR